MPAPPSFIQKINLNISEIKTNLNFVSMVKNGREDSKKPINFEF
jgi:hypothetical protein